MARILAIAGMAAVLFALPTVAIADSAPTTAKLAQTATFISPTQIDVPVTLSCTAGQGYWVNVGVIQPQGFGWTTFGGGNGTINAQCTGQQQKIVVSVYPFNFNSLWSLGDASATVQVCSWAACASDTRQIHVGS